MPVTSVHYSYRPPRIGWVVENDHAQVCRAMELSHMLLGGRYNPIIPADDPAFADELIALFELDLLWPVVPSAATLALTQQYPYLAWPMLHVGPFADGQETGSRAAQIVDVSHSIAHVRPTTDEERDVFALGCAQVRWEESDPLAPVFMATFGAYTDPTHGGAYREMFESALTRRSAIIAPADQLSADFERMITPSSVTIQGLERTRRNWRDSPGVFVGSAGSVSDCMTFWNLRASGITLLFFDPQHAARITPMVAARLDRLAYEQQSRGQDVRLGLWSQTRDEPPPSELGTRPWERNAVSRVIWNGLNIKPAQWTFEGRSALANVDDDGDRVRLTFEAPFQTDVPDRFSFHSQQAILTIRRPALYQRAEDTTLTVPFLPELNEFYSRNIPPVYEQVRAERDGIGMFVSLWQSHITVQSISVRRVIEQVFSARNIVARPSHAGVIARRMIRHLGRIQDCRVFMIHGVRQLLGDGPATATFNGHDAMRTIGQDFDRYRRLFIQPRESGDLTAKEVLAFLSERDVVRIGVDLKCPTCELVFWRSVDDLRMSAVCEYCSATFNCGSQLHGAHLWRYRRSGLFARDDHQEGAIPVLATLRCLDTTVGTALGGGIFATGFDLKPNDPAIKPCETDLVYIHQRSDGTVEIAIAECKAASSIDAQDVANLRAIAAALTSRRLEAFVIFSKTGPFTPEEISLCRPPVGQEWPHRTILLGPNELGEYDYRLTADADGKRWRPALGLEGLAESTHRTFFAATE